MIRVDLPLPVDEQCLPGRSTPQPMPQTHAVLGVSYKESPPDSHRRFLAGMGCFWGAERLYWQQPGVWRTAVGYAGGTTPNPTYHEVCSGETGHTEVVEVIYDPSQTTLERLLAVFCEKHDPTQGMRQGNDIGTQYRSALYFDDDVDLENAQRILNNYGSRLHESGFGTITTEVRSGVPFYFAEEYHQQYLAKNPNGYCGIGGTGIQCAIDSMSEPTSTATSRF